MDGRDEPGHDALEVALATTVNLEKLKAVVCRLIDEFAVTANTTEVALPESDFYWQLDPAQKRDMATRPVATEVGRLRDDWELTHHLADGPEQVSAYSLTEVAELLMYFGEVAATLPYRPREQDTP
ncbi:hypothetical protein C6569_06555 [Phreatobacter cathodiphilus]|uniref:Uncharacterized protein n=1 Tax=Phreatobacter cathodiphilus TaxID=1868589 RepID=A0A2S0N9C5_9HYPH|nr:hypothetical protein C6569_06555 [Phreatobacter cathodiphilus]